MKHLRFVRGLPGSGKSHLANMMKENEGALVFANDDYMTVDGKYLWTTDRAADAFHQNQAAVLWAMWDNKTPLVVDSCNIKPYHFMPYVKMAKWHQYEYSIIETNTPWRFDLDELEKRNKHYVTKDILEGMFVDYKSFSVEALKTLLDMEVGFDPEQGVREAQIAIENEMFSRVDELLYEYVEWRRHGGYPPHGADDAMRVISTKLEPWREKHCINLSGTA